MPLSPGQVLNNRYRIVRLLGQGGFGAVYRAWDTNLDYPRALKENLDTSPEAQRQFKREAQILTGLTHPNLPKVIDHFVVPGHGQYLVMDYIEGEDLGAMLEKAGSPLPESQVLGWVRQVCEALEYLHSQTPPIIHRDIKPANLKITPQGKALLVDFGIAKVYDPDLSTTAGARAVTPGYSPQEQYGMGATDARTDVYALGATLYHLLTGKQPVESVQRTMGKALDAPSDLNPAISPGCNAAILKAMEPLPEKRYQSIADFHQALVASISPSKPLQVQTKLVQSATLPISVPHLPAEASSEMQPATHPLSLKWMIAMITLGLVALLIYVLSNVVGKERGGTAIKDETATFSAIATTSIPFSTTLPTAISSLASSDLPVSTNTPLTIAAPAETLAPTPIPESITDEKEVEMVLIPAGEFQMGSVDGDSDERPVHTVYLDAYYMDVHEVTNISYAQCVSTGQCSSPVDDLDRYYNPAYEAYPVIYVHWYQARDYCEWRGGNLPTEAQWERAARGGLEGRKYPWGDDEPVCQLDAVKDAINGANFNDCYSGTIGVGSFSPNGYGLLDMAGNVAEWVLDWYQSDYYGSQSAWQNPFGPSSGEAHVYRGGSWQSGYSSGLRVSFRRWRRLVAYSSYGLHIIGLRCARPIDNEIAAVKITISPVTPISTAEPGNTATQPALPAQIVDEFGIPLALVPAGEFLMGSEDGSTIEAPVHTVYLDAYYMDVFEVTNARYNECKKAGECSPSLCNAYEDSSYADHPVVCVDWSQAMAYCQWRGGDLPTEAQWEKAARGGLVGKKYPWGDEEPVCQKGARNGAQMNGCDGDTVPVGSFGLNGYGLYDMAGNVWEWLLDWYAGDYYRSQSSWRNPFGPSSGSIRIIRGGSWIDSVNELRSAYRGTFPPDYNLNRIGFRCSSLP